MMKGAHMVKSNKSTKSLHPTMYLAGTIKVFSSEQWQLRRYRYLAGTIMVSLLNSYNYFAGTFKVFLVNSYNYELGWDCQGFSSEQWQLRTGTWLGLSWFLFWTVTTMYLAGTIKVFSSEQLQLCTLLGLTRFSFWKVIIIIVYLQP